MSKKIAFILLFFILGALFYFFAKGLNHNPKNISSALVGKKMPLNMPLIDLNQANIDPKQFEGKWFILNVFGSWCPTCYDEHPFLLDYAQKYRIIGLAYLDKKENTEHFLATYKNPYEFVIFDEKGDYGIDLGVTGAPESFFISDDLTILYRHQGLLSPSILNTLLTTYELN